MSLLLLAKRLGAACALLGLPVLAALAAPPTAEEMARRYERAATLTSAAMEPLVLNETVAPRWLPGGGDFWYRHALAQGVEYRLVKASGEVGRAFDHGALAEVASKASGTAASAQQLQVTALEPGVSVTLTIGATRMRCGLPMGPCQPMTPVSRDPRLAPSPDGGRALLLRDHDVWIRDLKDQTETALTRGGERYFAWGKLPDSMFLALPSERRPLPLPPWGFSWSPDGRYVVGSRLDERAIRPYPFLESVPQDGSFAPIPRSIRVPLMGEPAATLSAAVFDTRNGRQVDIAVPSGLGLGALVDVVGWSGDGRRFYATAQRANPRAIELLEVDAADGSARIVVSERSEGFLGLNALLYNAPNVRLVAGGREVLWYSTRSGWGHLYRYDLASGRLLNALTAGDWLVRDILFVDEQRRRIVFTASGREGGNPYTRRVYRVDFDGANLRLLTPEVADHTLNGDPIPIIKLFFGAPTPPSAVSPDGNVFVDTYSTVATPPVSVLRRVDDGAIVAPLATADATRLLARGWRPPEPFTAKAADGRTDLHGVLYWPDASMGEKVPLVDTLYGGPQESEVPHNFADARGRYSGTALNALGLATVVVDGRATPLRSQAFQDVGFHSFGDVATDDHAAVVRQLLARHPRLDAARVGVTGHSFGGYVSARAMLRHPEVFHVGVSSAGPHVYAATYSLGGYLPMPDYGGGRSDKPGSTANAGNYKLMDNVPLAAELRGRLLLGVGELDENAYPAATYQFIDALIKAGRRYDLVVLPNTTHRFDTYFAYRRWDYLVEHLLQAPLPDRPLPRP